MKTSKPLTAKNVISLLNHGLRGLDLGNGKTVVDVRRYDDSLSWIVEKDGWYAFRWIVTKIYREHIIRIRNFPGVQHETPKTFWRFDPEQDAAGNGIRLEMFQFKLCLHEDEIWDNLTKKGYPTITELAKFVEAISSQDMRLSPRSDETINAVPVWNLFEGQSGYPQYAWTRKALDYYNAHYKPNDHPPMTFTQRGHWPLPEPATGVLDRV